MDFRTLPVNDRDLLGGLLTGILGGPTGSSAAGGILGLPTFSFPTLSLPGLPTLSTPTSSASISASSSASDSLSLSLVSSASLSVSQPTSAPSTSVPPASTSAAASAVQDLSTGADGVVHTITNVFTAESSATQSASAATHGSSFLQNKALSGSVFGLAGLVGLVLIIGVATFALRRRRRRRLLNDAVSFDPGLLPSATDRYNESERGHSDGGSVGSGRGIPGYGMYRPEPPPMQQRQEYYDPRGPQGPPQSYYSAYAPPITEARLASQPVVPTAPVSQNPGMPSPHSPPTSPTVRALPMQIPRVPVRQQPLPATFGSSDDVDHRRSVEEAEFWARTLKVTNDVISLSKLITHPGLH
ncbi:hypothetical protein B0H10DRAFT_25410 [Mycena sp. CBHHK59/15]|nr:hypothetical protein B0H10DRAFT_25410 [Mycena sp. CBHHK59/15]